MAGVVAIVIVDRACIQVAPAASPRSAAAPGQRAAAPAPAAATVPFAPGACQVLAPTGGGKGRTVFVDAGHGGPDPGVTARAPSGGVVKESAVALAVATELSRRLRADGYRVVLSRSADTSVLRFGQDEIGQGSLDATQVRRDLQARVRCANGSGAAALLSIHFNGYTDPTVGGTQTIYDSVRPFAADSERLARALQSAMVARLKRTDRDVITDDALQAPTLSDRAGDYGHLVLLGPPEPGYVDQATTMPGALVEPLFLTAPAEASVASSQAGQKRLAAALASGVESYLSGQPA